MSLEIGKQRLTEAVRCLVDEPGAIKERLLIAYVSQLSGLDPEDDLPGELAPMLEKLHIRLSQDQVIGDQGNAASQITKISDQEASEIADDIFSMFLQIQVLACSES